MSAALLDVPAWRITAKGDELLAHAAALAAADAEGFTWLDGGGIERSLIGAWPDQEIVGDDLEVLDAVERRWRADRSRRWMGLITYEVGVAALLGRRPASGPRPGIAMRRFGAVVEVAPGESVRLCGEADDAARLADALSNTAPLAPSWPVGPWRAQWSADAYRDRVAVVKAHLSAGDSYQVNLAQAFDAPWLGGLPGGALARAAASTYLTLRRRSAAPMGGLVRWGDAFVLCNSPETLLDLRLDARGGVVRSSPIKGTRPRGDQAAADEAAQRELLDSDKDAAEHVMIVDLVRNDLGRVAVPGSVQAPARPRLVTLPTVHHLVSDVTARVPSTTSLVELVRALFPGGSITGAPKRRTIEIIESLEEVPRGIYCGALVLLEPDRIQLNIAIRTAVATTEGLRLHAGGGIVIDSDPEAERLESVTKTRAFAGP